MTDAALTELSEAATAAKAEVDAEAEVVEASQVASEEVPIVILPTLKNIDLSDVKSEAE